MKISALIDLLSNCQNQFGDVEVMINFNGNHPLIGAIEYEEVQGPISIPESTENVAVLKFIKFAGLES